MIASVHFSDLVITAKGGFDFFVEEFGHIARSLETLIRSKIHFAILCPCIFNLDQQIVIVFLVTNHLDDRTAGCLTLKIIEIHSTFDLDVNNCGKGLKAQKKQSQTHYS
jgi:hypothetical protein